MIITNYNRNVQYLQHMEVTTTITMLTVAPNNIKTSDAHGIK